MFTLGFTTSEGYKFSPRLVELENSDQDIGSGIGPSGFESKFYYFLRVVTTLDKLLKLPNISNLRYKLEIRRAYLMGLLKDLQVRRRESVR